MSDDAPVDKRLVISLVVIAVAAVILGRVWRTRTDAVPVVDVPTPPAAPAPPSEPAPPAKG
jgi:hypothetical protein